MDKAQFFKMLRNNTYSMREEHIEYAIDNNLIHLVPTGFFRFDKFKKSPLLNKLLKYPFITMCMAEDIRKTNLDSLFTELIKEKKFDLIITLTSIKRNKKYLKILNQIKDEPSISDENRIILNNLLQLEELMIIDHKEEDYQALFEKSMVSSDYYPIPFFDESIFTEENIALFRKNIVNKTSIRFIIKYLNHHKEIPESIKDILKNNSIIKSFDVKKINPENDFVSIMEALVVYFYLQKNDPKYKEIRNETCLYLIDEIIKSTQHNIDNEKNPYQVKSNIKFLINDILYSPQLFTSETVKNIYIATLKMLTDNLSNKELFDEYMVNDIIDHMIKFFRSSKVSRKILNGSLLIKKPVTLDELSVLIFGEKAQCINDSYKLLFDPQKEADYLTSEYINFLIEIDTKTELELNDFEFDF